VRDHADGSLVGTHRTKRCIFWKSGQPLFPGKF